MTASLLNGKHVAEILKQKCKKNVINFQDKFACTPTLAVILLGDDNASQIYVANKHKACQDIGINSKSYYLSINTSEIELLKLINELNASEFIHGILVQLPLPKHINAMKIITAITANKDVDGFNPYNLGCLAMRTVNNIQSIFLKPCTPQGIMQLLDFYKINIVGKNAVILGASNIVGRPTALELLQAGATVTICHRLTKNIEQYVRMTEILVIATGIADLVNTDWLHEQHIIIDVGICRSNDGKLRGEIDYPIALQKVAWITPVPGGVGPMTIVALLQNTILAAELQQINQLPSIS